MEFLTMLITAQRLGYLLDAHVLYRQANSDQVLDEHSMSDGEFLWLSRMGLVMIAQQEHDVNTLFMFDEPDVFLNEQWTMQFVSKLRDFARIETVKGESRKGRYNQQEYWIATHSTLILTDAFPEQTFFIEASKDQATPTKAMPLSLSTFGADRGEVSAQLFMEHERVGEFARQFINNTMDANISLKQVEKNYWKDWPRL